MDVFVKIVRRDSDEARAAEALQHFGDRAAVKVLGSADGKLFLERIRPGTPLGLDDLAVAHLCDVAVALHASGMPNNPWPTVEDWGRGFDWYRACGDRSISAAAVDRAAQMFAELAASQGARCLLHGDLHHNYILFDENRGWLAIDPKGVIGEPAYEFGAALRQRGVDQQRCIGIICERLGLDRQRVQGWADAQAVLSAIWKIEDDGRP
jgi:streptomycin 6-kinase